MYIYIGLALFILAIFFGFCASRTRSVFRTNKIRIMPIYIILAFISLVGCVVTILAGSTVRVSVSIYGSSADRDTYHLISSTLNTHYIFYVLNDGARGLGHPVATSCNSEQLSHFVNALRKIGITNVSQQPTDDCAAQSSVANFTRPHISLYLR